MVAGQVKQVVDEVANPSDGPALRPSRILVPALQRLLRLTQQAFEIADRADAGEVRLVEIDLVAVFERAHQLDAVHGAQVQVSLKPGVGRKWADAAPGDARDQVGQSALRRARSIVARGEVLLDCLLDRSDLWLLRGSAREVLLGPDKPAAHLLILRELLVGTPDHGLRIDGVAQDENGARLGVPSLLQADNHAVAHLVLLSQLRFQVLGINVHPFACNDDVLLAAFEIEIAFGVEFAEIAGAKPTFLAQHRFQLFSLPITSSNIRAAYQDFAIFIQLDLAALEHFADRAPARMKRMVQARSARLSPSGRSPE